MSVTTVLTVYHSLSPVMEVMKLKTKKEPLLVCMKVGAFRRITACLFMLILECQV